LEQRQDVNSTDSASTLSREPGDASTLDQTASHPNPVGETGVRPSAGARSEAQQVPPSDSTSEPSPFSEADLRFLDAKDLRRLVESLKSAWQSRDSSINVNSRAEGLAQACGVVLVAGPHDLGLAWHSCPLLERAAAILQEAAGNDPHEAHVCRLWIECAKERPTLSHADQFAGLLAQPLWRPAKALVFRALAHFGRRSELAHALPQDGRMSYWDADARVDAIHASSIRCGWTQQIGQDGEGLIHPESWRKWSALLEMETAIAYEGRVPEQKEDFAASLASSSVSSPRTYAEAVERRLAAQVAAAVTRVRLARGGGDGGLLASPAAQLLPSWERMYLQGLVRWVLKDYEGARACLESSMNANPWQNATRLALVALPVRRNNEELHSILATAEPTYEVLVTRSLLHVRTNGYEEAATFLQTCDTGVGHEPIRYTWAASGRHIRFQANALRTALAERRRDWRAAGSAWMMACQDHDLRTLRTSRQLLEGTYESMEPMPQYSQRRADVQRGVSRAWYEMDSASLLGTDAFFRGAAALRTRPQQAAKDFRNLLARRSWAAAEIRAGGGRLLFLGDSLLRLGEASDARRAYEMAEQAGHSGAKDRLAMLKLLDTPERGVQPSATLSGSPSFWPLLMAALGLLRAGDGRNARSHVEQARRSGASANVCQCLSALCDLIAGSPSAPISDGVVNSSGLSLKSKAILRFLLGGGDLAERLKTFTVACGEDWRTICPADPGVIVAHQAHALCEGGRYKEAVALVEDPAASGQPWAADLSALVRLRAALQQAMDGKLDEAEQELMALSQQAVPGKEPKK
jgi:tetratricopeptide (TPR) repeat protein